MLKVYRNGARKRLCLSMKKRTQYEGHGIGAPVSCRRELHSLTLSNCFSTRTGTRAVLATRAAVVPRKLGITPLSPADFITMSVTPSFSAYPTISVDVLPTRIAVVTATCLEENSFDSLSSSDHADPERSRTSFSDSPWLTTWMMETRWGWESLSRARVTMSGSEKSVQMSTWEKRSEQGGYLHRMPVSPTGWSGGGL